MYAKYVSVIGATMPNVLSDIARLIAGESIASLSSSCDKVNTEVLYGSTVTGWSVHDISAPAAAHGVILSAPDADGLTTKYVSLSSYSATEIAMTAYDTFNNVSHTGTNRTNLDMGGGYRIMFTTTTVNTFYIVATPRLLAIGSDFAHQMNMAVEFTREMKYLKGTNYPAYGIWNIGNLNRNWWMNIPRVKNPTAPGDLTGNVGAYIQGIGGTAGVTSITPVRDQYDQLYHQLVPAFANTLNNVGPYIGTIRDMFFFTKNYGKGGDELSTDDGEFLIIESGDWRMALKKG